MNANCCWQSFPNWKICDIWGMGSRKLLSNPPTIYPITAVKKIINTFKIPSQYSYFSFIVIWINFSILPKLTAQQYLEWNDFLVLHRSYILYIARNMILHEKYFPFHFISCNGFNNVMKGHFLLRVVVEKRVFCEFLWFLQF